MKKTLLLLPLVLTSLLVGCGKYASQEQARQACADWMLKAETIEYEVVSNVSDYVYEDALRNRSCRGEEKTNQILGVQGEFDDDAISKAGKKVFRESRPEVTNKRVVKNFYY